MHSSFFFQQDNNNLHAQLSNPPATVSFSLLEQSGDWATIANGYTGTVTAMVFSAWVTRQTVPPIVGDSVSYIVVPNVPLSTFATTTANQTLANIIILSNTPTLQAVFHTQLSILGATFYVAGSLSFQDGWNVQVSAQAYFLKRKDSNNSSSGFCSLCGVDERDYSRRGGESG